MQGGLEITCPCPSQKEKVRYNVFTVSNMATLRRII